MRAQRIALAAGAVAVLTWVLCLAGPVPAGTIVAQTGFNDAVGINSNPAPGSPYQLGLVNNQGGVESGWARSWGEPLSLGVVQNGVVFEGDQALRIFSTTA